MEKDAGEKKEYTVMSVEIVMEYIIGSRILSIL